MACARSAKRLWTAATQQRALGSRDDVAEVQMTITGQVEVAILAERRGG
jgi:hypothetical protein